MLSFLQQPYPLSDPNLKKAVIQSLLVGLFVTFVLVVFQPFGSYNWQHPYKVLILSGFGMVASVTSFLNFFVFPKLLPSVFREAQWTVWKELLWNLLPIPAGGFLSTLYGSLTGSMPLTLLQVTYMIPVVFLVGLFPAILLVLVNYLYLLRKYRSPEESILRPTPELTEDIQTLVLVADNQKDKLVLPASELLFIEASDNYCTFFHHERGKLTKTLLRSSLSRLESQIHHPRIIRCHRSYLVNLDRIQSVAGNAQGYKLFFDSYEAPVPVARSYSATVKAYFSAS